MPKKSETLNVIEENGIFYLKKELYINPSKLKIPIIVVVAIGLNKRERQERWEEWEWHSKLFFPDNDGDPNRVIKIVPDAGSEIKGHILIDQSGTLHDSSFGHFLEAISIRMEMTTDISSKPTVEKFRIGRVTPIEGLKHISSKNYFFNNQSIEKDIKHFLKQITRYQNQTIRVLDPYLSEKLLVILRDSVDKGTIIHILTTTKEERSSDLTLINLLSSFRTSNIEIIVKQVCKKNTQPNLNNHPPSNPFHDRLIIHEGGVLMIGISFNGLLKNNTTVQRYVGGSKLKLKFDQWFDGVVIPYKTGLQFKQVFP